MKFEDFQLGQVLTASITLTQDDFHAYVSFARTRNILHENVELAAKEGIHGTILP